MANNEVLLVGRAELEGIYQSLKKITDHAKNGATEVETLGKKTQETLSNATKKTENDIKKTTGLLRRMANQLYSDFKALVAVESLAGGLKISSQFKGAVTDSIKLSDTIRRLGSSFNIARDSFGKLHNQMSRGLGDIGASSEAAAHAIEGLSGLGVKGPASLMSLTKGAVTLAGMGGEKGNEKAIAGMLGSTLRAQNKDVNDLGAQKALIGEVTAAVTTTGKQASEILGAMDQMFSTMDKQLRGQVGPQGMVQMATMATTVGPMATKALQEYLSKSPIQRMAMEAQGFNVMGKNGQLDMKKLQEFITNTKSRTGMDARQSLMTAGFSEEASEGLVRLNERANEVEESLGKLATASRDNEAAFKKSMGLMDSFRGAINTVKGRIEEWTGGLTKSLTDMLNSSVGHGAGSAVVVGGAAALAAMLAGGGLRGVGKGLMGVGGGLAKKEAMESITGEKVQNVYVVNASEIGGASALDGAAGGMMGSVGKFAPMLKNAGLVGAAAAAGVAIGYGINKASSAIADKYGLKSAGEALQDKMFGKSDESYFMEAEQKKLEKHVHVTVETKEPHLKVKTKVKRGAAH